MESTDLFLLGLQVALLFTTGYVLVIAGYTLATGTFTKIK